MTVFPCSDFALFFKPKLLHSSYRKQIECYCAVPKTQNKNSQCYIRAAVSPLGFLKASKRILTKSICIIMDALRMHNPVEICHSPVWESCGYVVVSSTTWLQRDTRLLQSHISAWAVADNGDVLSVLSCFAVDSNTDSFIQLKYSARHLSVLLYAHHLSTTDQR